MTEKRSKQKEKGKGKAAKKIKDQEKEGQELKKRARSIAAAPASEPRATLASAARALFDGKDSAKSVDIEKATGLDGRGVAKLMKRIRRRRVPFVTIFDEKTKSYKLKK